MKLGSWEYVKPGGWWPVARIVMRIAPVVCLCASLILQQSTIYNLRQSLNGAVKRFGEYDAVLNQADGILKTLAGTPCAAKPEVQKQWDDLLGSRKPQSPDPSGHSMWDHAKDSITHMPPNGQCPAGTTRMRDTFTERDGSHKDACYNPKGEDGSIDVLNPGESVGITIQMLPPPPPGKDRRS
jgi:hypothetical protein